jgi:hypothetical protein
MEKEAHGASFCLQGTQTAELSRHFGFLFNCLTNDRRDRL